MTYHPSDYVHRDDLPRFLSVFERCPPSAQQPQDAPAGTTWTLPGGAEVMLIGTIAGTDRNLWVSARVGGRPCGYGIVAWWQRMAGAVEAP